MVHPPVPENEARRLAALTALNLVHTPSEERFDRITRMAAKLLHTPIALVSLVTEDRQWFKSAQGLDATETSREISFCGHAIGADETFVIEDASEDTRFADNPLVVNDPSIRFYAGHPLHAGDGQRVGTLCVIDRAPRHFSPDDRETLRDLAALVETEFERGALTELQDELVHERDELARKAMVDPLTRMWNRGAIDELLDKEIARAKRGTPLSVAMVDADHFKAVNDTYGHPVGDEVLRELSARIRASIRDIDHAGRYGGEEFLVLFSNCDASYALVAAERIRNGIAATPFATTAGPLRVTVSIGVGTYGPDTTPGDALVATVDRALYAAKGGGRDRVQSAGTDAAAN